ncbi:MAG: hypothetical protein HYU78_01070 [Rhodocyclales bacterium]|nr:hypothetical protein [Rhodocyclales bacterium]
MLFRMAKRYDQWAGENYDWSSARGAMKGCFKTWLFLLDDDAERDDNVALVYRKSLLYLVSRAYEEKGRVVPLLGMAKRATAIDDRLAAEHPGKTLQRFVAGANPQDTRADSHGGFDNDPVTMNRMLRLVLGPQAPLRPFTEAELGGY